MTSRNERTSLLNTLHPDVALALQHRVNQGTVLGAIRPDIENAEYGGVVVVLDGIPVRARVGKATTTKVGHFVTVWRRNEDGVPEPFRDDDGVSGLLVVVRGNGQVGVFSSPTAVLRERGIVSGRGSAGKRGFRLYAPWIQVSSAQARRTQEWQTQYFQML